MLQIDLTGTNKEMCKTIIDQCQLFGKVKSVNIYRSPTSYALVQMEQRKDATKVASKLGKATFDGGVLIPLIRK
jgi:hypothetical protein